LNESDAHTLILGILSDVGPESVLAVGPVAAELAATHSQASSCRVTLLEAAKAGEQLVHHGRHELAILAGEWEQLPRAQAAGLLAALRDVYARRILALLPLQENSAWQHGDMIGHGFTSLRRFAHTPQPLELFEFDVASYKTTPDWLNSKHWANPQLFDKYRW
jgi:hypothetical protein